MTDSVNWICPVCKGTMTAHKNDHHLVCKDCGYYTNTVFMQYFIQSERELEVRDELEKASVQTPPTLPVERRQ